MGISDAPIFDTPVELGLKPMTIVGPDFLDAERELFDDMIDKLDRTGLCVFAVDLERPVDFSHVRSARQSTDAIAAQNARRYQTTLIDPR